MNPALIIQLIELGLPFLETLITKLTASGTPAEVIAEVQAAYDALQAHRNDLVTKANIDATKG